MSSEEPQRPEKPSSGTGRFQGRGSSSGTGQPQGTESSQGAGKSGSRWRYTDGVPPTWLRKATIILGIVAVLIALAIVGSIVLPRWWAQIVVGWVQGVSSTGILAGLGDRKSTRLNSSHVSISYAVFCLQKKNVIVKDQHEP